jgi:tryptophanyl-tRNA synthetase
LPEAVLPKTGARIMGLKNPVKKMSKSAGGEDNVIYLLDSSDEIYSKIMSATTDSESRISFDESRPGIYNLLVIYELFSGMNRGDITKKFAGKGYAEFKKELAEVVVERLKTIQVEYKKISEDKNYIENVLKEGVEKARPMAEKKLKEVKNKIGLG